MMRYGTLPCSARTGTGCWRGTWPRRSLTRCWPEAQGRDLLSDEHFTVDGTLVEAWASQKSFQKKDAEPGPPPEDRGNPTVNFHGEKGSNETQQSTTDPEARLARKGNGKEAKLSYAGHVLMENRHGLVVNVRLTSATGIAERDAAVKMIEQIPGQKQVTVGADKNYDTHQMVEQLRERGVTPHVAQNQQGRRSAIDGRTKRHPGYAISQKARKKVEEIFGWMKTVGLLRKLRHRGRQCVGWIFTLTAAAYNLIRIRNLARAAPAGAPLRESCVQSPGKGKNGANAKPHRSMKAAERFPGTENLYFFCLFQQPARRSFGPIRYSPGRPSLLRCARTLAQLFVPLLCRCPRVPCRCLYVLCGGLCSTSGLSQQREPCQNHEGHDGTSNCKLASRRPPPLFGSQILHASPSFPACRFDPLFSVP